jgi:MFS family permease
LTFGWSSQGAGLIFVSLAIPIFLSPLIGMLSDRFGSRPLSAAGLLLATIFGPLLALIRSFSVGRVVVLVFFLVVIGLGISLVMTPEMAVISIFADSKAKEKPNEFGPGGATAQCCALTTIATAAAGSIGPLITGAIQSTSGWTATSIAVGAFGALGLVPVLLKAAHDRNFNQPKAEDTATSSAEAGDIDTTRAPMLGSK